METTGWVTVAKVGGKSTVTRCFSKYPLKFIVPNKVGPRDCDCVWICSLTYGGGIVSGDCIKCNFIIEDECTAVLTTQASTKVHISLVLFCNVYNNNISSISRKRDLEKVYKSVGSKVSQQVLEARVGSKALLVIIPDPVTCFSTARYSQKQVFRVQSDSNLVLVDWFTSGRYESGEKWDFGLYKSTNNILYEDGQPLFLDTVLLEQGFISTIAERMQDYQVSAMVVIFGMKLKHLQNQVQENVKCMMSGYFQAKPIGSGFGGRQNSNFQPTKMSFIASCSAFGPKGVGLIVRMAAETTESVYQFLRHQLAYLGPLIGTIPYS